MKSYLAKVRKKALVALVALAANAAPEVLGQTCVDGSPCNPSSVNNIVFAYQMKCDNATNDTAALQSALTAASSTKNAQVIIPPGTCLISGGMIQIPDNIELRGAGRYSTILRWTSGSGSSTNWLLELGGTNTGVTITDLTLDGNSGQVSDLLSVGAPTVNSLTIQRVQFTNAAGRAIAIATANTSGDAPHDLMISDNEFLTNGKNNGSDTSCSYGDIFIPAPTRLRILNNHFGSTGGTSVCLGLRAGAIPVSVEVIGNIFMNVLGFGIALGGNAPGQTNPVGSGVTINANVFYMASSIENEIDLGSWADVVVSNNVFTLSSASAAGNGIGDLPPASQITITGNRFNGAAVTSAPSTQNAIAIGASDSVISDNFAINTGGSGILLVGTPNSSIQNVVISNNVVKDSNRSASGNHDGIDLYLPAKTASDVIIKGNRLYDDQATPTQSYGIGLAANGQQTGFSNITIEGNDVRGNKLAGIFNNTNSATGIVIRGNPGYDPLSDSALTLTGQTGSIAFAPFYLTPTSNGAGLYRVSIDVIVTTAGSAGSVTASVVGSNGAGSYNTVATPALNMHVLGEVSATGVLYLTNDVYAEYSTTVSGASGGPQYALRVRLEYLGP